MEDVILESKLNYHSIEELETFGDFVLSKIKAIKESKNYNLKLIIKNLFKEDLEMIYPELYFIGVNVRLQRYRKYYVYKRIVKGKTIYKWFRTPLGAVRCAFHHANKYNLTVYKPNKYKL